MTRTIQNSIADKAAKIMKVESSTKAATAKKRKEQRQQSILRV